MYKKIVGGDFSYFGFMEKKMLRLGGMHAEYSMTQESTHLPGAVSGGGEYDGYGGALWREKKING